jgi:hypothetical protein
VRRSYGKQNFTGRSRSLTLLGGSRQRSSCGGAGLPLISILAPVIPSVLPLPETNCMAVKPIVISSPQLLTKYLVAKMTTCFWFGIVREGVQTHVRSFDGRSCSKAAGAAAAADAAASAAAAAAAAADRCRNLTAAAYTRPPRGHGATIHSNFSNCYS